MGRRQRPVDPAAARAFALNRLGQLADDRDRTARHIRGAAAAATDLGLTYAQIGAALRVTPGGAWHLAHGTALEGDRR